MREIKWQISLFNWLCVCTFFNPHARQHQKGSFQNNAYRFTKHIWGKLCVRFIRRTLLLSCLNSQKKRNICNKKIIHIKIERFYSFLSLNPHWKKNWFPREKSRTNKIWNWIFNWIFWFYYGKTKKKTLVYAHIDNKIGN